MHINLVLIPIVIILGLLLSGNDNNKNRRLYIVLCNIVLLFVAAMRSPEWMTSNYRIDTFLYEMEFKNITDNFSWNDLFRAIHQRYVLNVGDYDIGYVILQKIISLITHEFSTFSLIADLLFFIPFGVILYRYSTSIWQIIFAYVFYIALIQVFLFGGGRQNFAIGFDMMAFLAMADRKTWRSMIFLLLGVSIHFSSFLFLLPLLMIRFETSPRALKLLHLVCFLLFPIVLLFPNEIIVFMGESVGMEKYAKYGNREIQGGAAVFIILIELLSLLCFLAIRRTDLKKNDNMRLLYVMTPFMTILAPLIHSNGTMIRISLYYHLFLTLLVPYSMDCLFKEESRRIAYFIAIGALALLALQGGGMRYYFFWQV